MPTLSIVSATVLITNGCDIVSLHTELPCPFVPEFLPSQPDLDVKFEASKGTGADYVRRQFQIEPKIIDVS